MGIDGKAKLVYSSGTPIGNVAEGSAVYVLESGKRVKFILAKHNYESSLNGSGKHLLVRASPLSDNVIRNNMDWVKDTSLRTWLSGTYAKRLDSNFQKRVVSVSCKYICRGSTYTATGQKYLIPSYSDLGAWSQTVVDALATSLGNYTDFQLRDTTDTAPWNSDDEGNYYYYGYFGKTNAGNYIDRSATTYPNENVLPCFCVDGQVTVEDNGYLSV